MTLESTPPTYSSVNGDLVYVCYDANSIDVTKLNYKYVIELFINSTKVFTSKRFPNPDTNRGVFNIGSVIRDYCNALFQSQQGQGAFAIDVQVKIKEEYNGTLTAVVLTDSTRTFFNCYNARINDFTYLGTYANKVASNRPTITIPENCTRFYIPYFATTTSGITVVLNGSSSTITPSVANTMLRINIAINATANYTISIAGVSYNVKVVCQGFSNNYILHFLNKLGGYESVLFGKANKKTISIERKQFSQLPYRVDGSGVVSVKNGVVMHRQSTNFATTFKEKLKVSTDLLTDSEYSWLEQLVLSNDVYLDDLTTIYPIVLTESDYDVKKIDIDKLTNLSLNIEFGEFFKTQFS